MQVLFAPIAEEYEKAKCSAQPDDILRAINAEEQVYFQPVSYTHLVDWTSLEKVENPENNVQYQLYLATQIEKGNYTDASYQALQDVIAETEETLSNVWPSQNIEVSTGVPPVPVPVSYTHLAHVPARQSWKSRAPPDNRPWSGAPRV